MIEVCGSNLNNQLNKFSNNQDDGDNPTIYPPLQLAISPSLVLSYSCSHNHAVLITYNGLLYGIGNNFHIQICGSLPRKILTEFAEYKIKNSDEHTFIPISVVCCFLCTVYIVSEGNNSIPQICFSNYNNKDEYPLFLNLNGRYPVGLYGGQNIYAAAIDNEGDIIFLNSHRIQWSQGGDFDSKSLPNGDKAVMVSFSSRSIFVLGSTGKVYESPIDSFSGLNFSSVVDLDRFEIVRISGLEKNVLAVSKKGQVFGLGDTEYGIPKDDEGRTNFARFTEITALKKFKIVAAYAGDSHCLYQTNEGQILACGNNKCGQLNLNEGPSKTVFDLPVETTIKSGCSFCFAGVNSSVFFVNCKVPPNVPNKRIDDEKLTFEFPVVNISDTSENKSIKILSSDDIGRFRDKKLIGKGGQSHVYCVTIDKKYALKELDLDSSSSNLFESMNHLLREFEVIQKLNHPNIIKTFGIFYGDLNSPPSILLEFCPYNLFSIVKNMSNFERVTTIFEVAKAMKEVHENKIIHRDLKPENILYDERKHVKLSDFGIATFDNGTKSTKTVGIGTLKFMAPEILNESGHYDEKVDVYSFGVVMFFVLTNGKLPKISIAKISAGEKAPIPDFINDFSRDLILKCWGFSPIERPSFNKIIDDIEKYNFKLIDDIEIDVSKLKDFVSQY